MDTRRTIVVGDVHGCVEELHDLLEAVRYEGPARDRLIFLGDLLDRGPNPVGTVAFVRMLGVEVVLGNHEEKHLRWRKHEARRQADPRYVNPMTNMTPEQAAQNAALSEDDVAWLAALPLTIRLDARWVLVHGGLEGDRSYAEQVTSSHLVRVRDVNPIDRTYKKRKDPAERERGMVPWSTLWPGPESVLYGHAVHSLETPRVDEPVPGVRCYGIDTGCCFGGRLTAAVFAPGASEPELVQVPAHRAYAVWRGPSLDAAAD